jgi:hypothetical protein
LFSAPSRLLIVRQIHLHHWKFPLNIVTISRFASSFFFHLRFIIAEIGPYFYRVYSEKFNLERRPDLDQILYEQSTRFVFQRNMTAAHLNETDVFITVNSGFAAGVEMFWTTKGLPFSSSFLQVLTRACPV